MHIYYSEVLNRIVNFLCGGRIRKLEESYYWKTEELKARNEEINSYANVLVKKKQENEALVKILSKKNEALKDEIKLREKTEEARFLLERELQQSQKLEAVGRLSSGIAHEINTPVQYIGDNIKFMKDVFQTFINLLGQYEEVVGTVKDISIVKDKIKELEKMRESADIDYLKTELMDALVASGDGIRAISKIVLAMKEFSHPGAAEKDLANINNALESTITVATNEWKYISTVEKDFDNKLPLYPIYLGEFKAIYRKRDR